MKKLKMLAILVLVFTILVVINACGKGDTASSDQQSSEQQSSEQQAAEEQASIQAATDEQATAGDVLPSPETTASVDSLLGSWIDVNSNDLFANITKTETGYQYEDNDGKYAATYKEGVLKVEVADGETADVYIDDETGHMLLVYQDNTQEFSKK